jgi:hypothetical protein
MWDMLEAFRTREKLLRGYLIIGLSLNAPTAHPPANWAAVTKPFFFAIWLAAVDRPVGCLRQSACHSKPGESFS